jgi:hypothetical protein
MEVGGQRHTYMPPMPRDLPQLRRRIVEAVAAIDHQMLQRVWQELDYRIDIRRVTKGGYIEHCKAGQKLECLSLC